MMVRRIKEGFVAVNTHNKPDHAIKFIFELKRAILEKRRWLLC